MSQPVRDEMKLAVVLLFFAGGAVEDIRLIYHIDWAYVYSCTRVFTAPRRRRPSREARVRCSRGAGRRRLSLMSAGTRSSKGATAHERARVGRSSVCDRLVELVRVWLGDQAPAAQGEAWAQDGLGKKRQKN